MKSHVISVIQISQTQILQLTFMTFDESLSTTSLSMLDLE
jgi:hypothetical protein